MQLIPTTFFLNFGIFCLAVWLLILLIQRIKNVGNK